MTEQIADYYYIANYTAEYMDYNDLSIQHALMSGIIYVSLATVFLITYFRILMVGLGLALRLCTN